MSIAMPRIFAAIPSWTSLIMAIIRTISDGNSDGSVVDERGKVLTTEWLGRVCIAKLAGGLCVFSHSPHNRFEKREELARRVSLSRPVSALTPALPIRILLSSLIHVTTDITTMSEKKEQDDIPLADDGKIYFEKNH